MQKFKEVILSVLPITVIVLIAGLTIFRLDAVVMIRFVLGALFIISGLTIFLLGVDIGISPVGVHMGLSLPKSNKIWIVAVGGLFLGFFICIAEPDLNILAGQVEAVTSGLISKVLILVVVSVGMGIMLSLGLMRIVYNIPLYKVLAVTYLVILVLSFFSSSEFLAIAFDSSGATTGALAVPFMLALALGISSVKKDSKASEKDSFGLVGITSTGAILGVLILNAVIKTDKMTGRLAVGAYTNDSLMAPFLMKLPSVIQESIIALLPMFIIFIVFNLISFKLPKRQTHKIFMGFIYAAVGLIIFLTGVNAGFMDVGTEIGYRLASLESKQYLVIAGFILGFVTILAEPAVHVLTLQIEEVTSGYIKKSVVLASLSIGVAFAVALSMIRIIVPGVHLWHYLLPGYIISIALTFITPKLFVGIAFDSGGVASGPMTATFILAFAQGAAQSIDTADVLADGFGMIAMVAMMPIIALQILGILYKIKSRKAGVKDG
jgi:hypothetical protein